jgi:hypothetical protein
VPPKDEATETGLEHVEHEGNRPHQGTDDERHGDGQDHQQLGIGRNIRSRIAVPLLQELVSALGTSDLAPSSGQGEAP